MNTQQYTESFNGGWVPTTPPPDRFPSTPDDIPSRYLGECVKCGCEHHADITSAAESIPTTKCESCGEEYCTECPMGFCEVGDHAVCMACERLLEPYGEVYRMRVCLKCTGNVLEGPRGEIYQMKRAMTFALEELSVAVGSHRVSMAMAYLSASLKSAKERGY